VFEGKTKFRADATLDSLYMSIIQEAFGDDDPAMIQMFGLFLVLWSWLQIPSLPPPLLHSWALTLEMYSLLLSSVHSLLVLQEDINHPVQPFHKSFPDFIIDPTRCTNPRFLVCPPDQHTELLVGCLRLMNQELEQNMCKLPDGVLNSEVMT
jgi:hypothetical protein